MRSVKFVAHDKFGFVSCSDRLDNSNLGRGGRGTDRVVGLGHTGTDVEPLGVA